MKLVTLKADNEIEYFISKELLDLILSNCDEEGFFKIELESLLISTQKKDGITEVLFEENHFPIKNSGIINNAKTDKATQPLESKNFKAIVSFLETLNEKELIKGWGLNRITYKK